MKHLILKLGWFLPLLTFMLCISISKAEAGISQTGFNNGKLVYSSNYNKPPSLNKVTLLNLEANQANEDNIDIFAGGAFQFGGTDVTQIAKSVKDAFGNTYITGGFTGSVAFGTDTLTSSNGFDMYLAKLNADDEYVWARMASGSPDVTTELSLDGGTSITVSQNGEVYVGGAFVKSLTFVSAAGDTLNQLSDGREDGNLNLELFVAKYSTNGELLWTIGGNSGSVGAPNSLAIDRNIVNYILLDEEELPYIAGAYSGIDFLGLEVETQGKSDFFVASLGDDGENHHWLSISGTPEDDYALSISRDTLGYLNVLGVIGEGIMKLPDDSDPEDYFWDNDSGANDTFILSYDINGDWYFASFMGGSEQVIGNSVATLENGGYFVTGEFRGNATFSGSDLELNSGIEKNGLLVNYDINGSALWAVQFGQGNNEIYADKVTVDLEGNAYVLGRFNDFITFNAESDSAVTLTTETVNDLFIAKYDGSGAFIWAKKIEGTGSQSLDLVNLGEQQPYYSQPLDLAFSPSNGGELILSGDFDGTLTLDDIVLTAPANSRSSFVASFQLPAVNVSNEEEIVDAVSEFDLQQNYPNPFNPSTTIGFNIPKSSHVDITVYNSLGRKVKTIVNGSYAKGNHTTNFDATHLASGMYFYTIRSESHTQTKKMMLIK